MKLIKIKNDYYLVDDTEIQKGDWCLLFDDYGNLFLGHQPQQYLGEEAGHHLNKGLKKIISSTFRDAYGLIPTGLDLQEVKELIGDVDIRERVSLFFPSDCRNLTMYKFGLDMYNQALEDNKEKKYTQQELIWAIQEAYGHGQDDEFDGVNKIEESIKAITKHLQSKTEWEVEIVDGKLKLK